LNAVHATSVSSVTYSFAGDVFSAKMQVKVNSSSFSLRFSVPDIVNRPNNYLIIFAVGSVQSADDVAVSKKMTTDCDGRQYRSTKF